MYLITYKDPEMDNVKFITKQKSLQDFPDYKCFFETFSEANTLLFKIDRELNNYCRIICTKDIIKGLTVRELNKLILPLV